MTTVEETADTNMKIPNIVDMNIIKNLRIYKFRENLADSLEYYFIYF